MDIYKTTESLSDIVYDFGVSFILIPRTLFKVLKSPSWATEYVNSQSGDTKNRFEKYSSPVLFWLVIGILSYYFLLEFLIYQFADAKVIEVYRSIGIQNKIGGFIVFFISLPLSCAFVLQLFKYKRFEKTLFKRSFYIQCYITAPLQLFYIPSLFMDELSELWGGLAAIITLSVIIWFLVAEVLVSKKELECGWFKAVGALFLMYCSYWVFVSISIILFFLMNIGTFKDIVDALFADINI